MDAGIGGAFQGYAERQRINLPSAVVEKPWVVAPRFHDVSAVAEYLRCRYLLRGACRKRKGQEVVINDIRVYGKRGDAGPDGIVDLCLDPHLAANRRDEYGRSLLPYPLLVEGEFYSAVPSWTDRSRKVAAFKFPCRSRQIDGGDVQTSAKCRKPHDSRQPFVQEAVEQDNLRPRGKVRSERFLVVCIRTIRFQYRVGRQEHLPRRYDIRDLCRLKACGKFPVQSGECEHGTGGKGVANGSVVQCNIAGRDVLASREQDDAFLAGNLGASRVIASRNVERQGGTQVDGLAV